MYMAYVIHVLNPKIDFYFGIINWLNSTYRIISYLTTQGYIQWQSPIYQWMYTVYESALNKN